ncbi:hypothetical protein RV11_GL002723 [Enterococcus phoeniculicola]|nr:hypothetical protein RV11_GL002723 [Enterococcus phoeniculicola]
MISHEKRNDWTSGTLSESDLFNSSYNNQKPLAAAEHSTI